MAIGPDRFLASPSKGSAKLIPPPSLAEALKEAKASFAHSYFLRPMLIPASFGGHRPPSTVYCVYILKCSNNTYYVGCTQDLEDRLARHNNGHVPATKSRLPVALHTYIAFPEKYRAFEFEKYLKTGSGRAFLNKHLI